jgi:hypothetical protein
MKKRILYKTIIFTGMLMTVMAASAPAWAQDAASPKFVFFAGAGPLVSDGHSKSAIQAGAALEEAPPGSWGGFSFEGGYLGPWSKPNDGSAFFSCNYMVAWAFGPKASGRLPNGTQYWTDRGWKILPFATGGYTRLFGTGNAINFGGGIDYRINHTRAIRLELRDYYSFALPRQHNVALRIGWSLYVAD